MKRKSTGTTLAAAASGEPVDALRWLTFKDRPIMDGWIKEWHGGAASDKFPTATHLARFLIKQFNLPVKSRAVRDYILNGRT